MSADRDQLVLGTLTEFGIGHGEMCAPLADLALAAGLSEGATRRALHALVETGQIEFTGQRRGGTTAIYRRPGSRSGKSPPPPPEGVASGGLSATDDDHGPDLTPEEEEALLENSRIQAYSLLDELHAGIEGIGPPDAAAGPCMECNAEVPARWLLGQFQLCRRCRLVREAAGAKANDGTQAAGPTSRRPDPKQPPPAPDPMDAPDVDDEDFERGLAALLERDLMNEEVDY